MAKHIDEGVVTWLNVEVSRGPDEVRDYFKRMVGDAREPSSASTPLTPRSPDRQSSMATLPVARDYCRRIHPITARSSRFRLPLDCQPAQGRRQLENRGAQSFDQYLQQRV